jgi:hypothetical protein
MEINNLLEGSNNYKSMQADAARLADKWKGSGLLEGLGEREATNMSMVLENQAKQIVAEANTTGTGGTFTAGDGEQWAGVALPLVRKVFAQIVAQDFVSVQPMNLPSGLVFYLDFKYGTTTNGRTDGDNMYGNVSTGNDKMAVNEDVTGGLYGAGKFGYSINQKTSANETITSTGATSASLNYDATKTPSDYLVATVDLTGLAFDAESVRAFRLKSASIDVTNNAELTTVSGNNVSFVVLKTDLAGLALPAAGDVIYHLHLLTLKRRL